MKKFLAFGLFAFTGTAAQVAYSEEELSFLGLTKDDLVAVAHGGPLPEGAAEVFTAFYEDALAGFDVKAHDQLEKETILASKLYSSFARAYTTVPAAGCESPGGPPMEINKAIAPFPGGPIAKVFVQNAVADGLPGMLVQQALANGMGLIKAVLSVVLQIVPPLIPPPVWINQPLTCMPMVTGSNCLGAVLYPITAADFVTADSADEALDGPIAAFPSMYNSKVGKTSDAAYKRCFGAYMSMKCGATFPRCMVPNAYNFIGSRLPVCITSCIATLVMCPGFWIDDIGGDCMAAAVPPMCSQAIFLQWRNVFDTASHFVTLVC